MNTTDRYSRVCAYIDLDAVEYNIEMINNNIRKHSQILGVIKTDAYGHGAEAVASVLEPFPFMWGFGVATLEEAVLLRESGVRKPILILGYTFPEQIQDAVHYNITMTVFEKTLAEQLSREGRRQNKDVHIHIKLDTGMSRLGFRDNEESYETIREIMEMPNLYVEGVFSHFSRADERDKTFAHIQLDRYTRMLNHLDEDGIQFPMRHFDASAGIIDIREGNFDLVRAGISIYGMYPSEEVKKERVPLHPVLSLKSHVVFVKEVEPGTPVSYGGTYVTMSRTKIATIPVGYGDGYPRLLSNKGYVLIHGYRAPILGRVCMDMFMVDVTDIPHVHMGDEVTLIGRDGEESIPVETLSDLCGRFNYEFVCDLGKRVPRVFLRDGKVVGSKDYFRHSGDKSSFMSSLDETTKNV